MLIEVVRHGRTPANHSGLLLGRADPGLDEVGHEQAQAAAKKIGPVDRVIASPLKRAQETAALIAAHAGGLEVETSDAFIELDYGDWDERPVADVTADQWRAWRGDIHFAPPGGESLAQLQSRVVAGLDELVSSDTSSERVVVVSHVSPIKAATVWALGVATEVTWQLFVAQASITTIRALNGGTQLLRFSEEP